jgi:ankyrin repeat protein
MKYFHVPQNVAVFLVLLLALACNNRAGREEHQEADAVQKESTLAPMRLADPASEDLLRQAAYEGNEENVEALLGMGVDVNAMDAEGRTALVFAAFNGHSQILLQLLEAGGKLELRDAMGRTPLMYGSTGPFPEAVKILLDHGADPNAVDSDEHFTPLMHAAAEGHLEVVKVLLANGADPSLKDIDGDDAASFARQAGHTEVADFITAAR